MITIALVLSAAATALLATCANTVGLQTMGGIVSKESSWQQYAIGDNTARRSYHPTNYNDAVTTVIQLQSAGHNLDAGLAQINSTNWPTYGLNPFNVFDACKNLHAGAAILTRSYQGAIYHFASGDAALAHALSAYNSGDYYASIGYADDVMARARALSFAPATIPLPPPATPTEIDAAPTRLITHKLVPHDTPLVGRALYHTVRPKIYRTVPLTPETQTVFRTVPFARSAFPNHANILAKGTLF